MNRVDPLDSLKNFEPKSTIENKPKQSSEDIEALANKHGFIGRQSTPPTPALPRSKRRFRTGRNIQINIKGDQDTRDELYRVADMLDAPLGETLKRALSALRRELEA